MRSEDASEDASHAFLLPPPVLPATPGQHKHHPQECEGSAVRTPRSPEDTAAPRSGSCSGASRGSELTCCRCSRRARAAFGSPRMAERDGSVPEDCGRPAPRSRPPPPAPPPPEAGEGPRRAAAEPAGAPRSPPPRLSPRPPGSHTQTPPGGTISGEGPTAPHGPSTPPHPIKAPHASRRRHFRFRQHQISRERTLKGCRLRLGPLSEFQNDLHRLVLRTGFAERGECAGALAAGGPWAGVAAAPAAAGREGGAPRSGRARAAAPASPRRLPGVSPASPRRWSCRAWLRQRPPTSTDEPLGVPGKGAAGPCPGQAEESWPPPSADAEAAPPAPTRPHPP
ncbi:basic salivary proline-rich protein 1-like [Canis lupus familiaris]|uniref:basic salivary proline-rich protein 1-like n=1 Tax=Canis lupus familiaris TaxID=9615 RepID=UPI0018F4CE8D|nr:basic salivary proline-rich protein 1-like [Canis lupus familiaris]